MPSDFLKKSSMAALLAAISFPAVAQRLGPANLEAAKNRMQENFAQENGLNNHQLNIHQAYGRTIIIGVMHNRQNIHAEGKVATAAGTQLNVGVKPDKNATNVTGSRVDVEGTPGSVYVRVNTINHGNISADASGFNAQAEAAGNQINIKGARGVVSIHANTTSHGNIRANASGLSKVEADAAATQINIEGRPRLIRIDGTMVGRGDITATAKGGLAAALEGEW